MTFYVFWVADHVFSNTVCDVGGSGPHRFEILETNCTNN